MLILLCFRYEKTDLGWLYFNYKYHSSKNDHCLARFWGVKIPAEALIIAVAVKKLEVKGAIHSTKDLIDLQNLPI